MFRYLIVLYLVFIFALNACTKTTVEGSPSYSGIGDRASVSSGSSGNSGSQGQAGLITAGEWSDLANWPFWDSLIQVKQYATYSDLWGFYHNNRVAVQLKTSLGQPVANAIVVLKKGATVLYKARTDNQGRAELWASLFEKDEDINYTTLSLDINNGSQVVQQVKPYKNGVNEIVAGATSVVSSIELAFVVDATGSMADELSYLQTELLDVINRVKANNPTSSVLTSSVFYRDEGDDYVTRVSPLTSNSATTMNFIKAQKAEGGGDFPEAVHTALEKAINELQWSAQAKTRILFLLLDAPPHDNTPVKESLKKSIEKAAEKGIRIIPITASGIDKETEFAMRFYALSTNGTYVFVTNHSGIGNDHLEATVGKYEVEFLNNLMVRLIGEYAQ